MKGFFSPPFCTFQMEAHVFFMCLIPRLFIFLFLSFLQTLREMSNTWSPQQSVIPIRNSSLPSFFGLKPPCFLLTSESRLQHRVVKCELWSPDKAEHKERGRGLMVVSFIWNIYILYFFQTGYWWTAHKLELQIMVTFILP